MTRLVALLVLLAAPVEAAPVMLPTIAGCSASGPSIPLLGVDVLHCTTVVSPITYTATKLALFVETLGGTVGVAIYPDSDSGTQLGEAKGTTATVSATALSIPVVAGTRYRLCVCGSVTTAQYQAVYQSGVATGNIASMLNASTFPTSVGTAANACITGDPPATTGAITANIGFKIPLVLLDQ